MWRARHTACSRRCQQIRISSQPTAANARPRISETRADASHFGITTVAHVNFPRCALFAPAVCPLLLCVGVLVVSSRVESSSFARVGPKWPTDRPTNQPTRLQLSE